MFGMEKIHKKLSFIGTNMIKMEKLVNTLKIGTVTNL
jgi:hypothetical protein